LSSQHRPQTQSNERQAVLVKGFPVFARGLCIRGTGKDFNGASRINGPITLGDVTVNPGDLIVGDRDGVVGVVALP